MQTHPDRDLTPEFMKRLMERADEMVDARLSEITAGKRGESALLHFTRNDVEVTQRPDDEQKILRISIGGLWQVPNTTYCVIRGDRQQCVDLLKKALKALDVSENPISAEPAPTV
jgi:hypothetical protein